MRSRNLPIVLAAVAALTAALAPAAPAYAGGIEKDINRRWLGAWVVTRTEMYSDCNGVDTNNRINGTLVSGRGARRFQPGELAKVTKVDAGRHRIDVRISLVEPVLLAHREGPFTLYDEASCRAELEIEVPRDQVKTQDIASLDRQIAGLVERFSTVEEARVSRTWNKRTREPLPPDYEKTLRAHGVWKAEQHNAAVRAKLDEAHQTVRRVTERITDDGEYLRGFAAGVQAARQNGAGECPTMMAVNLREQGSGTVTLAGVGTVQAQSPYARGQRDGQRLVQGLELIHRLPAECMVEVPEP
jgi:hypothetical protein